MTTPYFYIIKHKPSGKKYAGSRWQKNCHPSELLQKNGYTTSSEYVNLLIQNDGIESFEIVDIIETESAYEYETKFLIENDCAQSEQWINKHNNKFDIETMVPYGSEEFKSIMIEKYDVDNCMKVPEFKYKQKKSEKNTLKQKYNVQHNQQIPEVKNKIKEFYKKNPELLASRACKIAENKRKNGTTGKGTKRPNYTNNGVTGKWLRTEEWREKVSCNQKQNSKFVKDNPMNDSEKRKLVSQSKIGRKRYYNQDRTKFKYCLPGTEPAGWSLS